MAVGRKGEGCDLNESTIENKQGGRDALCRHVHAGYIVFYLFSNPRPEISKFTMTPLFGSAPHLYFVVHSAHETLVAILAPLHRCHRTIPFVVKFGHRILAFQTQVPYPRNPIISSSQN